MYTHRSLISMLVYAGALPFIAATALAWLAPDWQLRGTTPAALGLSYALVILSFLCGAHWGIGLIRAEQIPGNLFLISNVLVVLLWGAYLFAAPWLLALFIFFALAMLLVIDGQLLRRGLLAGWYYRLRCHISLVVAAALALLLPRL